MNTSHCTKPILKVKIRQILIYHLLAFFLLTASCGTTKQLDSTIILYVDKVVDTVTVRQSNIPTNPSVKVNKVLSAGIKLEDSLELYLPNSYLSPKYPVAQQIINNYLASTNKEPGGHCLTASKSRFLIAYENVYGRSIYENLPQKMATKLYKPKQVFDHLYASTSGTHRGWRTLPEDYRGKGSAGAIASASMGKLVNQEDIWKGKLRHGAPMQVWKHEADYEAVVRGISDPDLDPFGHSFIFLSYVRDVEGKIKGIKIADQGYQSKRTLIPSDYDIWWGVNLEI